MIKKSLHERLFLLDGMALAYRAYFSFISRPLTNSKGENTSAIYGFTNALIKILDDEKPEHIAVVFDTKHPTFRHKMYEPYKATRQKMPEDMVPQIEILKEVVRAFNVPSLELNGYEADDIMGTLAKKAERAGIETFLVTGDKDFMQLISPMIRMYKPGKRGDEWEVIDKTGVKEKFGVDPERVVDVLGLTGDKSDNVPGVTGVGEKSAVPLVQRYGTIENIYKNIAKVEQEGLRKKLAEHKDEAFLSKRLVTIDTGVPIDAGLRDLTAKPRNKERLISLFRELGFKSLLRKLLETEAKQPDAPESEASTPDMSDITSDTHKYHLVATDKELHALVRKLKKSGLFVVDTETTSTDPLQAELVGISFATGPREAWYVPLKPGGPGGSIKGGLQPGFTGKDYNDLFPPDGTVGTVSAGQEIYPVTGFPADFVLRTLAPVLGDPGIKKIGQNIKYDILVFAANGIAVEGIAFDTMIANYILRPDGQHNLDSLAKEHLRYKTISFDELTGSGKERKDIRSLPVEKVSDYSNEDSDITFRLYETLKPKLKGQNLLALCEDVEFPLIGVLAEMEFAGVKIDLDFLGSLSVELDQILDSLTDEIYGHAGEKFNINSTQQLSKVLFEKLKLSSVRKTKTGFSTDVGVLETLRHDHPVIEKLLEYRQMQKLKNTYVDSLPSLINPKTGRVHTSFNQTVTSTGRLSSSDPNLQNIPVRTEMGSRMRRAFVPENPDMLIMSADYSQIELRIMAHISRDEGMTDAFKNGEDIHLTTAEKVFGLKQSEITKDMRRKAKEINFGIIYGIGPYGLANRLDIPQTEAKEIIGKYFERFPKIKEYIFDTIAQARRDGYVSTLLGRRRYLPDINSRNQNIRNNSERQAINMPIQGTAADMIKIAMVKIHRAIVASELTIRMLLQVHDELVFEVSRIDERKARSLVTENMINALPLSVPLEVDVGSGMNWLRAH